MYQCSKHGWVSKFEDCPKCSHPVKSISSTNTNQIETQTPDKKLTPMAELIAWIDTQYEKGIVPTSYNIHDKATSLLEAEREMAKDNFIAGKERGSDMLQLNDFYAKKYFELTYQQ